MSFVLPYDGVLFDWSGTLVADPVPGERLAWALRCLCRAHGGPDVDSLLARLAGARLLPDVPFVLKALHEAGVGVVVISDIHLDLRPLLARQGVGDLIDGYALSFEEGVEKPDPRLFGVASEPAGHPRRAHSDGG